MRRTIGIDHFVALLCLLLAAAYLWASRSIIDDTFGDPLGPRIFPQMLGGLLLLLSVVMLVRGNARGDDDVPPVGTLAALALTAAFIAGFGFLLPVIGYAASGFLLTLGFLLALRESLISSLVYSALLTAVFYVLFAVLLATPFPETSVGGLF